MRKHRTHRFHHIFQRSFLFATHQLLGYKASTEATPEQRLSYDDDGQDLHSFQK
jgi:hypothetical protein